ncbi:hypothetical protein BC943DRAFT_354027 [Umbelopsis sp. AD052]|nr:hypothetical protein BC943DRAFT_354027 [Umbelopsis sp. AD052]
MLRATTFRTSLSIGRLSSASFALRPIHTTKPSDDLTTDKLPSPLNDVLYQKVAADMIGTPDPISNLRPVKYYVAANETPEETEWRLHRQRVDQFNEDFWSSNNALFVNAKAEYEESIRARGEKVTAEALSVFYKDFLDKAYDRQMAYNKQWWKENIGLLYPGAKAAFRQLMQKKKQEALPLSFWDKNFE